MDYQMDYQMDYLKKTTLKQQKLYQKNKIRIKEAFNTSDGNKAPNKDAMN